jgi:hypothetical protein
MKIIEYAAIGLLILLFLGLAIFYGTRKHEEEAAEVPTPSPTADSAVRGRAVFSALENAGCTLTPNSDGYDVHTPSGTVLTLSVTSDDAGVRSLTVGTYLTIEPEDDSSVAQALAEMDRQSLDAVHLLFDAVLPVFHRDLSGSDTIVTQCRKTANSGTPYSAKFGDYTLRIETDLSAVPQTVTVTLVRN